MTTGGLNVIIDTLKKNLSGLNYVTVCIYVTRRS